MPKPLTPAAAMLVLALVVAGSSPAGAAYCGCDKPPPAANVAVRPDFSYPGAEIILFSQSFELGRRYTVNFYRFRRLGALLRPRLDASTTATAIGARDQGDFDPLHPANALPLRTQLRVKLPKRLHYGPSRIEVVDPRRPSAPVLAISQDEFTVIGKPIVLSETLSDVDVPYTTAMSHDGHIFFAFDMHQVRNETLVDVRMTEVLLPLFASGVTGWNIQGFNVGSLRDVPDEAKFGWRLFDANDADASNTGNASRIRYWRHEFNTWENAHHTGGTKVLVPNNVDHDYWHEDGTPHFDHDHIVIAVDVSELDPARILRGTRLNAIRLRISTTRTPNPYAADPNPTSGGSPNAGPGSPNSGPGSPNSGSPTTTTPTAGTADRSDGGLIPSILDPIL